MTSSFEPPLKGVRVVELTHTILGPSCGMILADLGAEVIKVEPVDGDRTRRLRGFGGGFFGYFNRNKKSLALDADSTEGRKVLVKLLQSADVMIENFAPGSMAKRGLGPEHLEKINPRLVYCALKGFLPGPYEKRPALDEVVQMMGGLAYMTGPTGRPLRAGTSVVDIVGGMFGAFGTVLALKTRDRTGKGGLVESALFESVVFLMGQHLAITAINGTPPPPMPERVSSWARVSAVNRPCTARAMSAGVLADRALRLTIALVMRNRLFTRCRISRMRRDSPSCASFRSVMSRAIFDAPMILPLMSLIGDMVTETWISSPSLRWRTVSKGATRSPRRRLAMMRSSSS